MLFNKHSMTQTSMQGPTRIWTAIAGFRVQSANRYTIGPTTDESHARSRGVVDIANTEYIHTLPFCASARVQSYVS
jgi:hypothetical protein